MKLDAATTLALVGALTGLVGTVSGSLIAYMTLKHTWDKDRHRVQVKIQKSTIIHPRVDRNETQLTWSIANLGHVAFTVANIGVQIGYRSNGFIIPIPLGTHPLGTTLERDQTCGFWTGYDDAVKTIQKQTRRSHIKIRAYVSDYPGNTFYSKWMDVRFRETWYSKATAKLGEWRLAALRAIWP